MGLLKPETNPADASTDRPQPSEAGSTAPIADSDVDPERARPQKLFPEFKLLDKPGAGGMGSVFKARQRIEPAGTF